MSISSPFAPPLTLDEQERYQRHLILPEVGEEGQRRLKAVVCCSLVRGASALQPRCIWPLPESGTSESSTPTRSS
jgi:molybdopterin/thiamine biosynthesis adenylyltransferase